MIVTRIRANYTKATLIGVIRSNSCNKNQKKIDLSINQLMRLLDNAHDKSALQFTDVFYLT